MDDIKLFELAVEQYSTIWLSFYLDHCPYSRIEGTCVGLKNGHLIVRSKISDAFTHPIVWGSQIQGYFGIRDIEVMHCHFVSKLVRLYNAPPDALLLVMPVPERLDQSQRRYSRRVGMHDEDSSGIEIWYGDLSGGDSEKLPQLRWLKLTGAAGQLGELSATGLRLELPENTSLAKSMSKSDRILLRGDFKITPSSSPLYVLGDVVRKMADPDLEGITCLGCQFIAWRKVNDQRNSTWFKCNEEGITQIAQWISRNFRGIAC